ncbi:hypothetical protein ACAX43_17945 [Paraburkholderia sp. IW21]|uniref:hypothetical protein n=1 Tax=Paraburkholderia sp. IW21 TaxID=3242488 RepID=UPI003521E262
MKIRSAELLVAVAIVTSATVMQIREHMEQHDAPAASAQAVPSCGVKHDGLTAAACEPTRDEGHADRASQPRRDALRLWV